MVDRYQYLCLLAGCVLVTLPLEFAYGFKVWRAPRRLAATLLPGFLLFYLWDLVAVRRGYWHFSEKFTTGWELPGSIPIEEALFFLIVPAAAISGFEAVRASLRGRSQSA